MSQVTRGTHRNTCQSANQWRYQIHSAANGYSLGAAETLDGALETAQRLADSYNYSVRILPCPHCCPRSTDQTVTPTRNQAVQS